jgi:hypothetical protein
MGTVERGELARRALAGYRSGPSAPQRATAIALEKVPGARTVVLVEGISDQIALETAAARTGLRLEADGVVILPMGGAHAILGVLTTIGTLRTGGRLAGLCDIREQELVRRALVATGWVPPVAGTDLEHHGFFACVEDLEDELVRAVGVDRVEEVLDSQGDLGSFRSLQAQPAWRGRPAGCQLHRFLASGSRRKLRYARLLVEAAVSAGALPRPLGGVLAAL